MVQMFRALESTGLRGFLGCPSVLYEKELEQFFDTALVKNGEILCVIHRKVVAITEDRFSGVFELPTEGLIDLSEVPQNLVFDARSVFSKSGEPVQFSCKKRLMKYQFRLLNDILAKSVTVKAGSFDVVTQERFLMMTAIHFGVKKRSDTASDAPVVKKKNTTTGKAATAEKDLTLVVVAQEAVPIQAVEPISIVPAERPHAKERKAPKRKLRLSTGSDDEIVEKEPAVETVVVKQKGTTSVDDVDNIIEQVIAETAQIETDVGIQDVTDFEALTTRYDDIAVEDIERSIADNDEESMYIEDLLQQIPAGAMVPSVIAAEPTRIKFGLGIQIPGVNEEDQYKASLPQIASTDKGKDPLVVDTIQGHPAHEIFSLICADFDFLVHLREQVIEEVANFFNSFSLRRLAALGSIEAIAAKEERVLNWGETDSVQIALQRWVYIIAKYRELLFRKFLEARRHNFVSGTPTTAFALKVLALLTAAHHFAFKFLLRNHQTIFCTCWIRAMILVDGSWLIDEGADFWRPITRPVDSCKWELQPQRPFIDDLAPLCAFIEPVQDIDSRSSFL
ncbi:hypothetical protein F511_43145 [Dorcoceras hygrometricum]|uniref:Splicing factor 3B subunit 1-like n=1 Tax=Dorcoceras hygrometricum TaxID=472368 RepID=A0A2Z6ZZE5_9LAMI|nr:hypothetical protein F511_43145 [Dorcoceras hygrometricum]